MKTRKKIEISSNSVWYKILTRTYEKLHENDFPEIIFSQIKYDDSYCKAGAGIPAVYWAFAKDSERTWIELELKARTKNREPYPQKNLYSCIKEGYTDSENIIQGIVWDEDDRHHPRMENSHVFRIKVYLHDIYFLGQTEEWANAMVKFIQVFSPILNNCQQ